MTTNPAHSNKTAIVRRAPTRGRSIFPGRMASSTINRIASRNPNQMTAIHHTPTAATKIRSALPNPRKSPMTDLDTIIFVASRASPNQNVAQNPGQRVTQASPTIASTAAPIIGHPTGRISDRPHAPSGLPRFTLFTSDGSNSRPHSGHRRDSSPLNG